MESFKRASWRPYFLVLMGIGLLCTLALNLGGATGGLLYFPFYLVVMPIAIFVVFFLHGKRHDMSLRFILTFCLAFACLGVLSIFPYAHVMSVFSNFIFAFLANAWGSTKRVP